MDEPHTVQRRALTTVIARSHLWLLEVTPFKAMHAPPGPGSRLGLQHQTTATHSEPLRSQIKVPDIYRTRRAKRHLTGNGEAL